MTDPKIHTGKDQTNLQVPPIFSSYYQSPIGLLKVSGTETYITSIHFIDHIDDAEEIKVDNSYHPILIQCIEQLIQYFQGQRRIFEFPIYQEGTTFQKRVWNELIGIPFGKTISYLEMARALGDVNVIRAAASANGKNNIVIVVPCHRVIGSNKELVGYGGGLWRKKWLLEHEHKIKFGIQTLF
jgi:methylated-DNA-[protein]-cysteine S-methyltransferase